MSTERNPIIPVAWFTATYLVLAAVAAAVRGNKEFVFYIAVMVVLCLGVFAVHRQLGLSRGVLWGLTVWGLLHMAGGLVPVPESWPINGESRVLYNWWLIPETLKYDHLVHGFGFGITTVLCWESLRAIVPTVQPTQGPLIICAAAGMGFGGLNEVIEFAATLLMPSTNVGGYVNTGWDLVSNLVGCTVAAGAIGLRARRTSPQVAIP